MRNEFEKLPDINESLSKHILFVGNLYTTHDESFFDLVNWLNGAWWMYQELHNSLGFVKGGIIEATYNNGD